VFNFEGGCYAKMINLSAEAEPEIYATTKRFGTVLENVVMDPRTPASSTSTTPARREQPRFLPDRLHSQRFSDENLGPPPANIILLTADAYGVLPPIARLTPDQAMYHFLSGYTARVAGTEIGVTEPKRLSAPALARLHAAPSQRLWQPAQGSGSPRGAQCWLVNTGWSGGKATDPGIKRMPIKATRALLNAALDGSLNNAEFRIDPNFGFEVPVAVPGVDSNLLDPRAAWADKDAYELAAE
jgi:phosphoenolpyruvate carboxykinase (ATP)